MFQRCMVLRPHQGFIHQLVYFPSFRGAPFPGFLMVSSPLSTLSHVSEVHVLVISLGFHSAVSSLSCFRGAWFILYIRVSFSSEFTFPCVRGTRFSGFIRVSFNCEFAFLSFRAAPFTAFLRVSCPVSTLSHVSEVHVLVISLGFHSPESSLSICQRCMV